MSDFVQYVEGAIFLPFLDKGLDRWVFLQKLSTDHHQLPGHLEEITVEHERQFQLPDSGIASGASDIQAFLVANSI